MQLNVSRNENKSKIIFRKQYANDVFFHLMATSLKTFLLYPHDIYCNRMYCMQFLRRIRKADRRTFISSYSISLIAQSNFSAHLWCKCSSTSLDFVCHVTRQFRVRSRSRQSRNRWDGKLSLGIIKEGQGRKIQDYRLRVYREQRHELADSITGFSAIIVFLLPRNWWYDELRKRVKYRISSIQCIWGTTFYFDNSRCLPKFKDITTRPSITFHSIVNQMQT